LRAASPALVLAAARLEPSLELSSSLACLRCAQQARAAAAQLATDSRMKDLIQSLSLGSGAAVVAVCSALLAWPLRYVRAAFFRWLSAVALPFVLAYGLYWSPVWFFRADPSEYFSWAGLFIIPWFLAGVVSSVAVVLVFGRRRAS